MNQDYSLQVEQLEKYGCFKIFHEKKSGKNTGRPELNKAMEYLRAGDKLAVYKTDRLARSTRDLHNIVHELQEKNIGVVFSKEQIDFSTPAGKLIFAMSGAIAEFGRDLIKERLERVKAQGKHLGRKRQGTKEIKRALKLFAEREKNGLSVNDISKQTVVPRSTIYAKSERGKIMAVDDHAINSLRVWFDIEYEELKKEWKSNKYEKLSDCPSFKTAYTYREALKVLIKGPNYVDETQLKRMIEEELEIEENWKNRK